MNNHKQFSKLLLMLAHARVSVSYKFLLEKYFFPPSHRTCLIGDQKQHAAFAMPFHKTSFPLGFLAFLNRLFEGDLSLL